MRLGYGIGKGFVVAEEEVLQQFDRIGSEVHKSIVHKLRKKVDSSRLDVIRSLGMRKILYQCLQYTYLYSPSKLEPPFNWQCNIR